MKGGKMESSVCKNVDVAKFLKAGKYSKAHMKAHMKWRCDILVKMLEEGVHADITLEAKGGSVKAHRSVLASVSPVFAAMFSHDMKEQLTSTVEISDISIDALRLFLLVLYTTNGRTEDPGLLELHGAIDKNFKEFHAAVMKYHIEGRLESVHAFALMRNLNFDNCWAYYIEVFEAFKEKYAPVYVSRWYILNHYAKLIKSESFLGALKSNPSAVCAVIRDAEDQALRKAICKSFEALKKLYA